MRIPLADLSSVTRRAARTRLAQLLLALLVVLLALAAIAAARGLRPEPNGYLPSGSNGLIVLDVSASISSDTYGRISATLRRLVGSGGRYGLILVSDTAYEALPPGSPARELRRFERFFRVRPRTTAGAIPQPPRSPWSETFAAGTRLSTGLQRALDVIRRDRLPRPAVLLVSDLDDDTADLESLTSVAIALRRAGALLRAVSLNAAPDDEQFVKRLLARPADVVSARLPGEQGFRGSARSVPLTFAIVALLVALALAGFLVSTERLRWRAA